MLGDGSVYGNGLFDWLPNTEGKPMESIPTYPGQYDAFRGVPTQAYSKLFGNGDGMQLVNTWFLFDTQAPDGKADIAWFKTETAANAAAENFVKTNGRSVAVGRLCYKLDPPNKPVRTNL